MANRIAHGNVTTMTMGMTDNDDGIAQDGSHTPANRLTSRYVALVYSILLWYWTSMLGSVDTCQNKISINQYSITWSYRRLKFRALQGHVLLKRWPLTKCWFSIGLQAHVRLTCCKQGWVVRRQLDTNTRLKINWIIIFSCIQIFSLLLFCFSGLGAVLSGLAKSIYYVFKYGYLWSLTDELQLLNKKREVLEDKLRGNIKF